MINNDDNHETNHEHEHYTRFQISLKSQERETGLLSIEKNNNDDFLLSCIGLTIQLGTLPSTIILYIIITGWNNQFITCFLFNFRAVNSQIQLVAMLFFSLTRFVHHFFPEQFDKMNQHLIGSLIKFCIVLVPVYLNFILGHTCGIDVFCPKDFRKSLDLITYSDSSVYQEELQALLLRNLECRTKMLKVVTIFLAVLSNIHELLHGENCIFPWDERSLKSLKKS